MLNKTHCFYLDLKKKTSSNVYILNVIVFLFNQFIVLFICHQVIALDSMFYLT